MRSEIHIFSATARESLFVLEDQLIRLPEFAILDSLSSSVGQRPSLATSSASIIRGRATPICASSPQSRRGLSAGSRRAQWERRATRTRTARLKAQCKGKEDARRRVFRSRCREKPYDYGLRRCEMGSSQSARFRSTQRNQTSCRGTPSRTTQPWVTILRRRALCACAIY
jgi:hypothetical protein